jgi:DNA-binding LytR/AlgR family response regulator
MKLTSVIVDDEPVARKVLREFVNELDYVELIGEAENPLSVLSILKNRVPDIIFLDINMPKLNGIEFLRNTRIPSSIIMTTAYSEHAVEAFELNVLDYLVKPIAFERFLKACEKALEFSQFTKSNTEGRDIEDHFFIKSNSLIERVLYDDLVYAEAMLNYVMLHTVHKKIMVYVTIKSLEEQLPSSLFIKVHKSFIVNRSKIKSIEGNLVDVGGKQIAISQNLREKVMSEIVKERLIRR